MSHYFISNFAFDVSHIDLMHHAACTWLTNSHTFASH